MPRFVFAWMLALLSGLSLAVDETLPQPAESADTAEAGAHPGAYCPDRATMYLILEELTIATEAVAQARETLLVLDDAQTAEVLLIRANTALALATGRGSGARVATLIDAALAAKEDGNPKATLLWFPTIKLALQGLREDPAREAANTHISRAEAILQGQSEGDEIQMMLKAKQLLKCDPLHIPLGESLSHLTRLDRDIARGTKPAADDFALLVELLNRAMRYALQRLAELERQ